MKKTMPPGEKSIWVHCSSLGEFEQGRPLIELLKEQYPAYKIVLTFFSPSGYEARKDYAGADYVFYLPHDGRDNADKFLGIVRPSLAIFVKYEFWYHYLHRLKELHIPVILASATFQPGQVFFKWYGDFFRSMLQCFTQLFVQDIQSEKILLSIGISNVTTAGDTRYDRVAAIVQQAVEIPLARQFKGDSNIIIAGSTWPADEAILQVCAAALPGGWKMIIAPHETDKSHIQQIQALFGSSAVLFSQLAAGSATAAKRVLIIDNIGMLSSLYAYGNIAYVGGGFDKAGIHNILEPAVFGLPVVIGPVYNKYVEAKELVAHKYALPVTNATECSAVIAQLTNADLAYYKEGLNVFMQQHTGATKTIYDYINSQKLLQKK